MVASKKGEFYDQQRIHCMGIFVYLWVSQVSLSLLEDVQVRLLKFTFMFTVVVQSVPKKLLGSSVF